MIINLPFGMKLTENAKYALKYWYCGEQILLLGTKMSYRQYFGYHYLQSYIFFYMQFNIQKW